MAIFKCKMCGGTIEFEPGATVGVCDSCGTKQTLPRLDDDRKVNLYDRANHFRRNNEFDKASGIYEQILNEDMTDAEAYWSLVLCRYGIEYVEDPATHKRIPTINRAQFTSIFDDDNYKSALKYADAYQRAIYEQEAAAINEIQKGILEISSKEEPFDVFICYKETDQNGRRTMDSVLATDLYHQLTQEGFKVFFSRITLEDKLGTAYEPYIFAALNSAKVMVVLGTKPEHFNAVWVKNEWSRYLALVKQSGGKKVLIPAYRDMDPYDLPDEFSHLQAQDMSKLGFMQDLIRGIKKIAQANEEKPVIKETVIAASANASTAPLLRRAFMYLEDGEWQNANDYCEKVLDQEPENARAYVGKLMAELQVRKEENLKDCEQSFDKRNTYLKAVRFGDEKLVSTLKEYNDHINERNENARLRTLYYKARNAKNTAKTEEEYKQAAKAFQNISRFEDAEKLAQECLELAENARKDGIYGFAKNKMIADTVADYEAAIKGFATIPGWKDSDDLIETCKKGIEKLNQAAEEKKAKARRAKKIEAIIIALVLACIAAAIVILTVVIPLNKYNTAKKLYENGQYEEAIAAFEALNGFSDSKEMIYNAALKLFEKNRFEDAITAFTSLADYRDSEDMIEKCRIKIKVEYETEKLKTANVGEYVVFGSYEQDNDTWNGNEDIAWLVLAREENKLLLISQYALEFQPYDSNHPHPDIITWETCSLRRWLTEQFFSNAFNTDEQKLIQASTVTADQNPEYDTFPGNDTTDKVFLLSIAEVEQYFASKDDRKCAPTDYAIAQEGNSDSVYASGWWLRSPGLRNGFAAYVVLDSGHVSVTGLGVGSRIHAVRPALWINLDL